MNRCVDCVTPLFSQQPVNCSTNYCHKLVYCIYELFFCYINGSVTYWYDVYNSKLPTAKNITRELVPVVHPRKRNPYQKRTYTVYSNRCDWVMSNTYRPGASPQKLAKNDSDRGCFHFVQNFFLFSEVAVFKILIGHFC